MNTAVCLLGYNRPILIDNQLKILHKNNVRVIRVYIDGYKDTQSDLTEIYLEIFGRYQEIFNDFKYTINSKNYGCKLAIERALKEFFNEFEEGIILEDDCVPSDSFFSFCNVALNKFKFDYSVGMISGNNFLEICPNSFRSKIPFIWGWATWSDRWKEYYKFRNVLKKNYQFLKISDFTFLEKRRFFRNSLRALNGAIDTWDYPWIYYNLIHEWYTIIPKRNLITNIGFGAGATHTSTYDSKLSLVAHDMTDFNLDITEYDSGYDKFLITNILKFKFSIYDKIFRKIRSI